MVLILMGFWVKEETIIRDGKVVRPTVQAAAKEWEQEHHKPSRFEKFKTNVKRQAEEAYQQRLLERDARKTSYRKARIERAHKEGRQAAWSNGGYGNVPTQRYRQPQSHKSQNYSLSDILGMGQPRKPPKKPHKAKQSYVVVGGVAYKKGSTGGHKKHHKQKKRASNNPYDFVNFKPW